MKVLIRSFKQFIIEIWNDTMLAAIVLAPIMAGLFFKFIIPRIEILLTQYLNQTQILAPYYLYFDLLLASMAPLMFSIVGAMVMLSELDFGLSEYLAVTPLGKRGYLSSRIIIPTIISIVYGSIITSIFTLNGISLLNSITLAVLNGVTGIMISLLVVSISSNKVEGMALSKLSSILLVATFVPFFITEPIQYLTAILPSYWIGKLVYHNSFVFILPFCAVSAVWLNFLYRKFLKKIM